MMELTEERRGDVDILTLRGAIHAEDNAAFARALSRLRREGRWKLVIDARGLEYLNSRAIGQLVEFSREARLEGGKVVLVQPGPGVSKILQAVGLASLIPSYDTPEQAVAACSAD